MKKYAAISVLGKDQPGIVAAITKVLFETGCNIEDSSMTLLRSEFAMILMITLAKDLTLKELKKKISPAAKKLGLTVSLRSLVDAENKSEILKGDEYIISVYGADKPGIVYEVSKFLSENGINITDVQTRTSQETYIMFLEVDIPVKLKLKEIKSKLIEIGKKLKIIVNIKLIDSPQL